MTATENQIYDADRGEWVDINDSTNWTMVDDSEPDTESASDSVVTPNCSSIGKRHKFKDRETGIVHDHCLVCGSEKTTPTTSSGTRQKSTGTRSSSKTAPLDSLLSMAWMGIGVVVRNVVPEPAGPAAGKMIQLEAGIAGPKLHKALKKTPLYPYLSIATDQFAWVADIAMLLTPPLIMGLAAARPDIARGLKPVLIPMLVPVLAEASKKAEEQAALLESLEQYSEETIQLASDLIDQFTESPLEDDTD